MIQGATATATSRTLHALPTEILLLVLSLLDPVDVLNVRKTCRSLHEISFDRFIWTTLHTTLSQEQERIPLPDRGKPDTIQGLSTVDVESLVLSVHLTDRRFTKTRPPPRTLDFIALSQSFDSIYSAQTSWTILNMNVLADRWLVVVYQGGVLEIWDLCPESGMNRAGITTAWWPFASLDPICKVRYRIQDFDNCTSSAAAYAGDDGSIIVAVASQAFVKVLRLDVIMGALGTICLASLLIPAPLYPLKAMDLASHTLVFSHALEICFLNWESRRYCTVTSHEEGEELWSGITGLAFLSKDHVLCVKTRSIEIYSLDFIPELSTGHCPVAHGTPSDGRLINLGSREAHVYTHRIPDATLRGVSFSDAAIPSLRSDTLSMSFAAYDILRGLFQYEVRVTLPPASPSETHRARTSLDVSCTLLAAHHMAQLVSTPSVVQSGASTPTPPRGGFTQGPRGFISACAMGAQGRRGVWIERQRTSMGRAVFGFVSADHRPSVVAADTNAGNAGGMQMRTEEDGVPAAQIDGRCLYEVRNSYDLRDDLTHCAFSEVTGKVVLGTRRGQLLLL